MNNQTKQLKSSDIAQSDISHIDIELANYLERQGVGENMLDKEAYAPLYLLTLFLLREISKQSVCLKLTSTNEESQTILINGETVRMPLLEEVEEARKKFPHILSRLEAEGESGKTPLLLTPSNMLYFQRHRVLETRIVENLIEKIFKVPDCETHECVSSLERLQKLHKYFEDVKRGEINFQHLAASLAHNFPLFIITGGPGTGKTTVVSAILGAALLENENCKIVITAPTGKAANQMSLSLREEVKNLNIPDELKEKIVKNTPYTLHRLLKIKGYSREYLHTKKNPIDADLIVIDEASMISLSLFESLLSAIPKKCKIILLGDKNQLASVEEGAIFSNLCDFFYANLLSPSVIEGANAFFYSDFENRHTTMTSVQMKALGSVIELTKTHRFSETSNIFKMKKALEESKPFNELEAELKGGGDDFIWTETPAIEHLTSKIERILKESFVTVLSKKVSFDKLIHESDPVALLEGFSQFKILTSHAVGPYGSVKVNQICQSVIVGHIGLVSGLPIMILENDYNLGLFNGDFGVVVEKEEKLYGAFQIQDKIHHVPLSLLPKFEVSYAMTVHKSQGSGYDKIVILYPESESPLLTRELLYTAITRAKKECILWMNSEIYTYSMKNQLKRESGIYNILIEK
ncbi:MAG: exodeoxyribonuclease V subunit alpha [Fusobacteria bacterium]|nr:exodeoxyribonuclease V subunit alpha [Fusobacteriota bacterium]